jgi:DNA-binding HxlR family transcriptional regulator
MKSKATSSRINLVKKLARDPQSFSDLRMALKILGDKWSVLILIYLTGGPARFKDIESVLEDITPRTLTAKLKSLEQAGLITKKAFQEFPPRTEYRCTKKTEQLKPTMIELSRWARKYCKTTIK